MKATPSTQMNTLHKKKRKLQDATSVENENFKAI